MRRIASSFPLPATAAAPASSPPARGEATCLLRRIQAFPPTRGSSNSVLIISVGTTVAVTAGGLSAPSEALPNSGRIARAFDSLSRQGLSPVEFSGSFDAASEDVLMRHQKVLRRGIERCALRPSALRVRARAVRYRRGIASGERVGLGLGMNRATRYAQAAQRFRIAPSGAGFGIIGVI